MTARRMGLLLAAPVVLVGFFGRSEATSLQPAGQESPAPASTGEATSAARVMCPLTLPNGRTAPDGAATGMNHGNGKIWTAMWPHDVVIASPEYVAADGSVGMKWGWWRGVEGKLTITGHRLDAHAPPLTAHIPSGYGDRGFQATGIDFPTDGCWEVTGAVGNAELTFVTLILTASRYSSLPQDG